jgi:hypothetical protein
VRDAGEGGGLRTFLLDDDHAVLLRQVRAAATRAGRMRHAMRRAQSAGSPVVPEQR